MIIRPALAGDEWFLFSVYAGTRLEEMDRVDENTAQKEAFLCVQFRAQDHPALNFCRRLGFHLAEDHGAHSLIALTAGKV